MNSSRESVTDLRDRKACISCTKSKRKCDKRTPSCQRCSEKGMTCQYLNVRPYTRIKKAFHASRPSKGASTSTSQREISGSESGPREASPVDMNELLTGSIREGGVEEPGTISGIMSSSFLSSSSRFNESWFLGTQTWLIDHSLNCPLPPLTASAIETWLDQIWTWLHQWIRESKNAFIHEQLYLSTGLPRCLQDAWTSLTAYFSITAENKATTMAILQARADELIMQDGDDFLFPMSLHTTMGDLARTQALFVYQFIRLFDGDIRQRALAEKNIPVMFKWCKKLWEWASLDAGSENFLLPSSLFDVADPVTHLHEKWVLGESIRRIWILTHLVQGLYLTVRDGRTDCPGGIYFTMRQGLWDAASSRAWGELVQKYDPLFILCAQANQVLTNVEPSQVDTFSKMLLKLLYGNEKNLL
ncbi:hypothetical protein AB5N19_05974 [Seiridium cardinale]|uniref:Zn(2)-C6 fungal-type domain-containing protein n=1 Tax=Seiridium cardinale TaxID=138064 RepID=A0ABR2Y5D1_9PEZI